MKKIITICAISILSLQVFAENVKTASPIATTESAVIIGVKDNENKNEVVATTTGAVILTENTVVTTESAIVVEKKNKAKTNRFIRVKGIYDLPGELQGYIVGVDGKTKLLDIDAGFEAMVEGVYRVNKSVELAMGLGAQSLGAMSTSYGVQNNYYAIPFYFSLKYNVLKSPFYLKGIAGVTFNIGSPDLKYFVAKYTDSTLGITENDVKIDNGNYLALGLGIDIWKVELEALYSVNKLSASYTAAGTTNTYYSKMENARITVGMSYAFDWNKK